MVNYEKWAVKIYQKEWNDGVTWGELIERAREHAEKMQLDPDEMEAALEAVYQSELDAEYEFETAVMDDRVEFRDWQGGSGDPYAF